MRFALAYQVVMLFAIDVSESLFCIINAIAYLALLRIEHFVRTCLGGAFQREIGGTLVPANCLQFVSCALLETIHY